jgi:Putative beta-lactamase-inhibitor-like, PepSY-like
VVNRSRKAGNQMKATCVRLIAAVLLMAGASFAQTFTKETRISEYEVPDVVLKAFESAYPKARVRSCTKVESNGTLFYKIESVDGATHREISYSPDGRVTKTEVRIVVADLPVDAQQAIQEKYPKAEVTIAERVTQDDQVGYEVSVRKDEKLFHLKFDANGKLTAAYEVKVNIVTQTIM